jgi:hypothetical protein
MATIGSAFETLSDIQKKLDPDGKPARMINLLSQSNPILLDMPWMPTNDTTTHRVSVITSLPTATERQYNEGVVSTKETAAQFVESTSMVEMWSEVDKALVDNETDPGQFRFNKAQAFIEALNQKMTQLALYGNNSLNAKQINGFLTRYNSLSAPNAQNIIDGGGVQSDNTSMLLVGWGVNKAMGLYPKNSQAGMDHEDKGVVTKDDTNGTDNALMDVYRDKWMWNFGITVEDWRYVARVANIDVSSLRLLSGANLSDLMIQAEGTIPYPETARLVWYVPRLVYTHLARQRRADVISGGGLDYENVDGKRIPFFNGIPVRVLDGFSIAETRVV